MSLIGNLVTKAKAVDRYFWPNHRIVLSEKVISKLKNNKLRVADVGSADGPEERWLSFAKQIQFITFEPNPRTDISEHEGTINFPIGLWSSKQKRPLFITGHPDSSSLYNLNRSIFADFLIQEGSQVVNQIEIELDTLDSCLGDKAELNPHFLKIDVEGGDLEVMKGAELALESTVLGIRTEATLHPLWEGAPQLWTVNEYLQKKGFTLFNLGKVQWVRNNGMSGYTSQPQLIWGDAVYFLTKNAFLNRLKLLNPIQREILVIHFIMILLAHGCHDYAVEIVEAVGKNNLVKEDILLDCKVGIIKSTDSSLLVILWILLGAVFALIVYIPFGLFKSTRTHAKFYLKQRIGRLCFALMRWAGKAGRPYGASIEDQFD